MELKTDLEHTRQAGSHAKASEARQEQGDEVNVQVLLPNGTTKTLALNLGVTVGYVKALIAKEIEMSPSALTLKMGDRTLIDPFSLCDIPGVVRGMGDISLTAILV
jgi:hypothetical protein